MTLKQENYLRDVRGKYESTLAAIATSKGNRNSQLLPSAACHAVRLGIAEPDFAAAIREVYPDAGTGEAQRAYRSATAKGIAPIGSGQYSPRFSHHQEEPSPPYSGFVRRLVRDGGGEADFNALTALSPIPVSGMTPETQTAAFLVSLFKPSDRLFIFDNTRHERGEPGHNILTANEWLERIRQTGDAGGDCFFKNALNGRQGTTGEGKPSYTSADCVAAYKFALVEFDHLPPRQQAAFWLGWLRDPSLARSIASLVWSGGKSIHGLVRTGADELTAPKIQSDLCSLLLTDPETRIENGKTVYPLRADENGLRPHGGARLPGVRRRGNGKVQTLLYLANCATT